MRDYAKKFLIPQTCHKPVDLIKRIVWENLEYMVRKLNTRVILTKSYQYPALGVMPIFCRT